MPQSQPTHTYILLIAWLAFLIFVGINEQPPGRISFLGRKLRHKISGTQYRAPLLNCDNPEETIPENYCIFLHPSCPLLDHDLDIPDLTSAPKRIFEGRSRHGLYCCVEGISNLTLEAIRGDLAVDKVECDTGTGHEDCYEAPLGYDMYQQLVEGSYAVELFPGFSFEGHKCVVGREVDLDGVAHSLSAQTGDRGLTYRVDGVGEDVLEAIRRDRAVHVVEYTRFDQDDVASRGEGEEVPVDPIVL